MLPKWGWPNGCPCLVYGRQSSVILALGFVGQAGNQAEGKATCLPKPVPNGRGQLAGGQHSVAGLVAAPSRALLGILGLG